MCSVLGIIGKDGRPLGPVHHREAGFLLQDMTHRGPDAGHILQCSGTTILGSNRLRVTDNANPGADMPFLSADKKQAIVFNGEVYNFQALKRELSGYPFRTESDTEVVLAAYRKWGRDCVDRLQGMFAFAIHDANRDSVFMACDPSGQKTIYTYEDKDAIVFASEADALIKNPYRSKTHDVAAMGEFVAQRYITGADTHIREIKKIEPGTWAEYSAHGRQSERFYRLPIGDQAREDIPAIAADIRNAVEQGAKDTFHLEVPYGLLLSGGIDSTAVLAAGHGQGLRFKTFSIGFSAVSGSSSVFNEFEYSRDMARTFGTEHREIVLEAKDYCTYLDKWADISGEPLGSQEAPTLIKLFEASASDVRVMFTGSGPDEVFDGYSYGLKLRAQEPARLAEAYYNSFQWSGNVDTAKLMPGTDAAARTIQKYESILDLYAGQIPDVLQQVQALHFHGRLAAYEFRQMDVISMRHSIEARSPLIEKGVLAAAFDFNPGLKQVDGDEKGIYKRALSGLVPDDIVRRRKQGFPVPSEMWFSRDFEQRAQILFEPNAILSTAFGMDKDYLRQAWDRGDAPSRNIFSRLYTVERMLRRQSRHMSKTL